MASKDSGGREYLWRSAGEEPGGEERTGGAATATDQRPGSVERARELAQWWWGWWISRHGYSGIILPAGLAVFYWIVWGWPAILLGAGLGMFARLLWSRQTKPAKIGAVVVAALPIVPLLLPVAAFIAIQLLWAIPIIAVVWLIWGRRRNKQPTGPYHARWAEAAETEDMRLSVNGESEAEGKEGILLAEHGEGFEDDGYRGRAIGVYPGFEGRREMGHILVAGPTRSGKGLHLISNLLRCRGSAIVNDIKSELYNTTARWREDQLGSQTKVLDPSGRGNRYDPFVELSYRPEALMSAAELIMSPHEDKQPIFGQRAMSGLYAAALAAKKEGAPTLSYVRELTKEGPREFTDKLNGLGDEEIREHLIEFIGDKPENLPDDHYHSDHFFTSSWENLITKMRPFYSKGVMKMCGGHDFGAADLMKSPTTLYLMFSESDLRYTHKVYQVMLQALITGLIRHGDINPGRGDEVPLLLALDEAGRTPIPELDNLVSTISGRGMAAMLYFQDLGQIDAAYDEDRAKTIRGNCHTQLFYRPAEPDTAKYISRMSGQTSVESESRSQTTDPSKWFDTSGRSWSMRERELITEDEAMQVSQETVFAFVGAEKPPIRGQRLKWFDLMPEAARYAEEHPPAEPEELPMPEIRRASTEDQSGPDPQAEPEDEPSADDTGEESANGGRRRRRGSGGGRGGGYIEPDV